MSFCAHLQLICGFTTSQNGVTVEEQAAIFLYACVTGLSVRHPGERFQCLNETISKYVLYPSLHSYNLNNILNRYFKKVLVAVSEGNFYNYHVKLPDLTSVSDYIHNNSKFYPFFANALGSLDGTHINSWTTAAN
jgi:hypothetical protein